MVETGYLELKINGDGFAKKTWDEIKNIGRRALKFAHLVTLAPAVGLEPTTLRLTAACSAIELCRNIGQTRLNIPRYKPKVNKAILKRIYSVM